MWGFLNLCKATFYKDYPKPQLFRRKKTTFNPSNSVQCARVREDEEHVQQPEMIVVEGEPYGDKTPVKTKHKGDSKQRRDSGLSNKSKYSGKNTSGHRDKPLEHGCDILKSRPEKRNLMCMHLTDTQRQQIRIAFYDTGDLQAQHNHQRGSWSKFPFPLALLDQLFRFWDLLECEIGTLGTDADIKCMPQDMDYTSPSRCTLAKATDQHHERVSARRCAARYSPLARLVLGLWPSR